MTNNEDIICVDETPFDDVPENQRPKAAKKWAKAQYKDAEPVTNKNTGRKIKITGGGIGHTVYNTRHPHAFYLLSVLPEIIERAEFICSEEPKLTEDWRKPEPDLMEVERYGTKARLRGKLYDVELTVKVKKGNEGGDRELDSVGMYRNYYGHDLYEK